MASATCRAILPTWLPPSPGSPLPRTTTTSTALQAVVLAGSPPGRTGGGVVQAADRAASVSAPRGARARVNRRMAGESSPVSWPAALSEREVRAAPTVEVTGRSVKGLTGRSVILFGD